MLTEAEYAEQQRALGRRIHLHQGVYWEEGPRLYCKPAFLYRPFARGAARPKRLRSVLGFSHQVADAADANRSLALMVMTRESLNAFDIGTLPPEKRRVVRQGLARCEVRLIEALEPVLERVREINIDQSKRQEAGAGAETPVSRFIDQADAWRAQVRSEFALRGREWWGAYVDGVLAAYLRTFQVDGVRVIQQVKAATEQFKARPVDALYYTVLQAAARDVMCQRVVNGDARHASLNRFKEQFHFRVTAVPYFSSNVRLVNAAKRLLGRGSAGQ